MTDRSPSIELRETSLATDEDILDAIDAASDQDTITWLTNAGKRIAAIVPVDVAEHYLGCMGEVAEHVNQVTSAGRAMRGCRECGLEGTHKMGCSRR